jgi:pilus assembly protein FimV
MNNLKRVSAAALAGATLALASGTTYGMGFGRPVSRAVLGEPLRVSVPLRLDAAQALAPECITVSVHDGEARLSPSQVQVSLVADNGRDTSVQIRTTSPINEPIVTYQLTIGCQININRQFVVLADPPGLSMSLSTTPAVAHSDTPGATSGTVVRGVPSRVVTTSQAVTPSSSARAGDRPARRTERRSARVANNASRVGAQASSVRQVTKADEATASRTSLVLTPKAVAPVVGRLVLDPIQTDAAAQPDLRMTGSLSTLASAQAEVDSPELQQRRAAAAALWQAMNLSPEDIARDRQKLLAQERMLAQIQAQGSQASQPVVAEAVASAPLAQRPVAQAQRPWLLYVVGGLALSGLLLCVALFLKLRRRQQAEAEWWQSQMLEPAPEHAQAIEAASAQAAAASAAAVAAAAQTVAEPTPTASRTADETTPVASPQVAAAPVAAPRKAASPVAPVSSLRQPVADAMREVSVEELIDLEQQAEFFVVLGQDDAAIDLLESHVQSVSASPLPFLKLLEIYQRLGKHSDYERVQAAFNERFNGHAPAWEADLQHGHQLTDYPGVMDRLQALWALPSKAMEVLEKSLTRPESEADTFDLPAYRELLFLYAVARDLSEREVADRSRVDLLASEPVRPAVPAPFDAIEHGDAVEPLMATRPVKAMREAQPAVSLDLQLDDLPADTSKAQSSYGDVTVVSKATVSEHDVEHIDLPGLSAVDVEVEANHKP